MPSANHLQPIRAIRIESGGAGRSRTHFFQIFFHRRLRALKAPPRSHFGAAGTLRGSVKRRRAANVDGAKPLMESMFCAFIKYWAALPAQRRRKTPAPSRYRSGAHNR
jgi:hypothetical protein